MTHNPTATDRPAAKTHALGLPLEDVGLDAKTASVCAAAGYDRARDVLGVSQAALARVPNIGRRRAGEILWLTARLTSEEAR